VSFATFFTTQEMDKKTKKPGIFFVEIAINPISKLSEDL
jgi:hypothetical protein